MYLYHGEPRGSARQLHVSKLGRSHQLSPHFTLGEMQSKDGADHVLVHPQIIAALEAIRLYFNKPVVVNSGYRTPQHNRNIGGVSNSLHVSGMAADIVIPGISNREVQEYAKKIKVGGLGIYNTFTHIDVYGDHRTW